MNRLVSIILLMILNLQIVGTIYYVGWFTSNQKWIALELCIKKDQAENTCQGKCVLGQKMKELDSTRNQISTFLKLVIPPAILSSEMGNMTCFSSSDLCFNFETKFPISPYINIFSPPS